MFTWKSQTKISNAIRARSQSFRPSRLQCSKVSTSTWTNKNNKNTTNGMEKMLQKIAVNNLQRIVSFEMHLVVSQWKNAKAMFKLLAVIIPLLRWFIKAVWTRWKNQMVSHSIFSPSLSASLVFFFCNLVSMFSISVSFFLSLYFSQTHWNTVFPLSLRTWKFFYDYVSGWSLLSIVMRLCANAIFLAFKSM